MDIQYCNRCLYTSLHPLYLTFDKMGVCSGCRVHEEKDQLDWNERLVKLKKIVKRYKNLSGNNYDCIVPVSGARDSYFIVHTVKKILGLNPLLVTYNKHYNTDIGIRNLANLRIKLDCDLFTLTVSPETVKKITRATLRKLGSIYWHCIAGQTVFPVQIAVKTKIPLIIWGVHQGIDQVGMFSHYDQVEMMRKYRKEHDLMGFEAEDLIDDFDMIKEEDVVQYKYPDDKEIERIGVRGIYLSNYFRWDSKTQHEKMIKLYGYETAIQHRTFDTYNDIDCFHYSDLHDYIKYLKYGYGKATDHACREIRLKKISREEAQKLVKIYQNREPNSIELFLNWIGMTQNGFNYIIDQHRNKFLWQRNKKWEWEFLKHKIKINNHDIEAVRLKTIPQKKFLITQNFISQKKDNKYILIGKGYYKNSM